MWFEFVSGSRTLVFPTFLWLRRYFIEFAVVELLFQNRPEQIIVELGGETRSFVDGDEALKHALTRE